MTHRHAGSATLVAGFLVVLGFAADAHAQAWVSDRGTLGVSADYNFSRSTKVLGDEEEFPDAGVMSHQVTIGAEYIPIDKLAVSVGLPLLFIKYTGDETLYPHTGGGRYDDGDTHTTLTDFRSTVRYQVLDEPLALSPHLGFSIPVADYETVGNAVGGRHLKALHAGLSLGRVIGAATYVHLSYEFSLVESYDRTPETAMHSQHRSDLTFTVGHAFTEIGLDVNVGINLRETHGGIGFDEFPMLSMNELLYHDAILDEDIFLVGAGVAYQINEALSVTLAGRLFAAGSNTQNASVFALGLAWTPIVPTL